MKFAELEPCPPCGEPLWFPTDHLGRVVGRCDRCQRTFSASTLPQDKPARQHVIMPRGPGGFEADLLAALTLAPSARPIELARTLRTSPAHVANMLSKLVKRELVFRRRDTAAKGKPSYYSRALECGVLEATG